MLNFKINIEKCTRCGLCSLECPTLIIDGKNGIPELKEGKENNCIRCQHCMAVCPTAALSILGKNPKDSVQLNTATLAPEALEVHMKTRRATRRFKDELLDEEVIHKLVQTASYAPTGHNKNQVLTTVTYTRNAINKVRDLAYGAIHKAAEDKTLPAKYRAFANFYHMWKMKDVDVLLRKAPHFIATSAPGNNDNAVADGIINLSYFELLANSMGIATLWNGFAKSVFEEVAPELKTQLDIPADHVIGHMMVFGKPAVKYARAIQSEGLHLNGLK